MFSSTAGRMLHIRCALKPKKNARVTIWRTLSIIHFSPQLCSACGKQKTLTLPKERSLSDVSICSIFILYCCFFVDMKNLLHLSRSYSSGAKLIFVSLFATPIHQYWSQVSNLLLKICSRSAKNRRMKQFNSEENVWTPNRPQVLMWFSNVLANFRYFLSSLIAKCHK